MINMGVIMKQLTESQRLAATLKIMEAVDEWGLSGDQIIAVMDLPETQRTRHLQKFRDKVLQGSYLGRLSIPARSINSR